MKEMYSGEQAKAIDTHAIDTMGMPSLVLMEKAAMSVVSVLLEKAGPSDTFLCVCGIGNNGGDGVCVARILHEMGYQAGSNSRRKFGTYVRRNENTACNCFGM